MQFEQPFIMPAPRAAWPFRSRSAARQIRGPITAIRCRTSPAGIAVAHKMSSFDHITVGRRLRDNDVQQAMIPARRPESGQATISFVSLTNPARRNPGIR